MKGRRYFQTAEGSVHYKSSRRIILYRAPNKDDPTILLARQEGKWNGGNITHNITSYDVELVFTPQPIITSLDANPCARGRVYGTSRVL